MSLVLSVLPLHPLTTPLVVDYYCNIAYHKNVAKRGPEARLYTAMVGGILLPVGSWIYAWTSYSYVHWIFPCIGISILCESRLLLPILLHADEGRQ